MTKNLSRHFPSESLTTSHVEWYNHKRAHPSAIYKTISLSKEKMDLNLLTLI